MDETNNSARKSMVGRPSKDLLAAAFDKEELKEVEDSDSADSDEAGET